MFVHSATEHRLMNSKLIRHIGIEKGVTLLTMNNRLVTIIFALY